MADSSLRWCSCVRAALLQRCQPELLSPWTVTTVMLPTGCFTHLPVHKEGQVYRQDVRSQSCSSCVDTFILAGSSVVVYAHTVQKHLTICYINQMLTNYYGKRYSIQFDWNNLFLVLSQQQDMEDKPRRWSSMPAVPAAFFFLSWMMYQLVDMLVYVGK